MGFLESFRSRWPAPEKHVTPLQISVVGGERNQPKIELSGAALAHARSLGIAGVYVSLTHTKQYACAFVVLERA